MLAASLTYTEDSDYYVAYTVIDVYGHEIVALESQPVDMNELPPELKFNPESLD